MTEGGRRAAAADELRRAAEELVGAEALLRAELPRIAETRIYFAVFHALRACLYRANLEPRTHEGVLALFGLHFVKTGRFERSFGVFAGKLQKFRLEADYGTATIDHAEASADLETARELVARVRTELDRNAG